MFGYVKPVPADLLVREHELYQSLYCGICRAMQRHTGRLSAFSLSYDAVFYALVRLLLTGERLSARPFHCIVHPCRRRTCVDGSPVLIYTARAFSVLAYGRVCDAYADRRGPVRLPLFFAKAVLHRAARRAALPALQADMERELKTLADLEAAHCDSLDAVADCTGRLLGLFFASDLAEEQAAIAYSIGFSLGRYVALCDAAEDYEADRKAGNYNPYLYIGDGKFGAAERSAAYHALCGELLKLEEAVLRLPADGQTDVLNILKNILYLGLPGRMAFLQVQEERGCPHGT